VNALSVGVCIYSMPEVCVGHAVEWWGAGRSHVRSQQRRKEGERGMQAAGLCLSLQHREPTVLD